MKNTFGNRLINELRKFNKFDDKSNIKFIKNLKKMGFSNSRIALATGISYKDYVEKLKKKEYEELNYLLLPFVEKCVEILKTKFSHVREGYKKMKSDTLHNVESKKAANFWFALSELENL